MGKRAARLFSASPTLGVDLESCCSFTPGYNGPHLPSSRLPHARRSAETGQRAARGGTARQRPGTVKPARSSQRAPHQSPLRVSCPVLSWAPRLLPSCHAAPHTCTYAPARLPRSPPASEQPGKTPRSRRHPPGRAMSSECPGAQSSHRAGGEWANSAHSTRRTRTRRTRRHVAVARVVAPVSSRAVWNEPLAAPLRSSHDAPRAIIAAAA